jgi:hypothetical protein
MQFYYSSKVGALPTECQQEAAVLSPLLTQFLEQLTFGRDRSRSEDDTTLICKMQKLGITRPFLQSCQDVMVPAPQEPASLLQ